MLNIKRKQFLFSSILLLVGSGLSLIIAFWNGFPIIYSDTGAYIDMGFRNVLNGIDQFFMVYLSAI
ncbi:hypothetical protein N8Z47_03285 [Salibacteraceae bacterium]|nr:hypothetical protein [Salibacteraceae bacterium]